MRCLTVPGACHGGRPGTRATPRLTRAGSIPEEGASHAVRTPFGKDERGQGPHLEMTLWH